MDRTWLMRENLTSNTALDRDPKRNRPSGLRQAPTERRSCPGFAAPAVMTQSTEPEHATYTAKIADDCGHEKAQTGGHFTIDSIKIDVLGAK